MSVATPSADLRQSQLDAIEASGWGASFRVMQPRNLCAWVFLWNMVLGAIATLQWYAPATQAVATAVVGGVVVFSIYGLLWAWCLRLVDRWSQLPGNLVFWGFLWGGLAATFQIALTANSALFGIYNKTVSTAFTSDWGPALVGPPVEETAKGIGILLLIFMARRIVQTQFDGLILGAFVGLGFQSFEDVLYVVNSTLSRFGTDQVETVQSIFWLRGSTGLLGHCLFSGVVGVGMVTLLGTSVVRPRRLLGVGLILLGMAFHFGFNGVAALAGTFGFSILLSMLAVWLLELITIILVFRIAGRGERSLVLPLLAPEVERGTLTQDEVAALGGTIGDRRKFTRRAEAMGYRSRKQAGHILDAATDLARAIGRSGGEETDHVRFARAEVARVRAA